MALILASQSVQRAELLHCLVDEFQIVPADLDELSIDHQDHVKRAMLVAQAKAREIAQSHPDDSILAADTFVLLHGKRLEKPATPDEAAAMLASLSSQTAEVLTGAYWIHQGKEEGETVTSKITFRELSEAEIDLYVAGRPVTAWAGGFSIKETAGLSLLSSITGSVTAVAGLPLEWVKPRLIAAGLIGITR